MKKILLSICLTAATLTTLAQSDKTVTFGVKGGVNFSTLSLTIKQFPGTLSKSSITNFHAGVFVDFKIADAFSIQPALLYTGKGGKSSLSYSGQANGQTASVSSVSTDKINYLQLPVNFLYHVPVGNNNLFFGAGPFLAYGLNGTTKGATIATINGVTTTETIDTDINFGDGIEDAKRMDYGIGILAGFKFDNGLLINAGYDLGLANIQPSTSGAGFESTIKTRVITLGIGYAF